MTEKSCGTWWCGILNVRRRPAGEVMDDEPTPAIPDGSPASTFRIARRDAYHGEGEVRDRPYRRPHRRTGHLPARVAVVRARRSVPGREVLHGGARRARPVGHGDGGAGGWTGVRAAGRRAVLHPTDPARQL